MKSFKAKLVTTILAYGFVIGGVVGALLYYLLPSFFTNWFYAILGFFIVTETLLILYVEQSSRGSTSRGLVNTYMITKLIKTILTLGCIAVYAIAIKENTKGFVIIFLVLYMLFLVVETMLFAKIEQRLKEKKQ